MKNLTIIMGLAAISLMANASAATIGLDATIRDFKQSHSDFEGCIDGVQTGLVETTLGADGKPVKSSKTTCSIASSTSFNQWYNDVSGVNLSTTKTISLENTVTNPDIYSFSSSSFFPIDGELFGNEGNLHNYHFTLEMHTSFTYQGGEDFSFTGDDDLWVFIDDTLAVDIGGVHGAATRSVDLDTLGLTKGQDYSFDLFFAERHLTASNFNIQTSILLKDNSVPEPSILALMGFGLLSLGFVRRRV